MFEQTAVNSPDVADRNFDPASGLISRIDQSALVTEPFDHVYLQNLFPPDVYKQLLDQFPGASHFHQLLHPDALRADGSSTRLRFYLYPEQLWKLPRAQRKLWIPLARALISKPLQDAFKRKFRRALEARFGCSIDRLSFYPVPILVRDLPGYRIGIHSDVLSKAITVQFYLPEGDSQSHIGTIFHTHRDSAASAATRRMSFLPASGYAFPVQQAASWHSAATTTEADGERRSIMLTYYVQRSLKQRLRRRFDRLRCAFGVHADI